MPAENTSYYEIPIKQEGKGEGGTNSPCYGEQTSNDTNKPSGPNTDAWGDGDEGDGSDV